MPKAATGRGEKTTAASAVIPKKKLIVRMTLAPYEALKVGHPKGLNDHQRALLAIGSYGRGRNAQAASSRMSALGVKRSSAGISGMSRTQSGHERPLNLCGQTRSKRNRVHFLSCLVV